MNENHEETTPETAEPQASEEEVAQPQIAYGISIFTMTDTSIEVHITGDPDLGEIQRLLGAALQNVVADITARKVVQAIKAEQMKPTIHRP